MLIPAHAQPSEKASNPSDVIRTDGDGAPISTHSLTSSATVVSRHVVEGGREAPPYRSDMCRPRGRVVSTVAVVARAISSKILWISINGPSA